MLTDLDNGARCDRHVGEVFPVRCADCLREQRTFAPARNGFCTLHPDYPSDARFPCARCERDADDR